MDPPPRDKLGGDPIEMAGLFEGDIAGVSQHDVARKKGTFKVSSYLESIPFRPRSILIQCTLHEYLIYRSMIQLFFLTSTPCVNVFAVAAAKERHQRHEPTLAVRNYSLRHFRFVW